MPPAKLHFLPGIYMYGFKPTGVTPHLPVKPPERPNELRFSTIPFLGELIQPLQTTVNFAPNDNKRALRQTFGTAYTTNAQQHTIAYPVKHPRAPPNKQDAS